jgi:HAD superfamily hydrolase (TIGR01490 family)
MPGVFGRIAHSLQAHCFRSGLPIRFSEDMMSDSLSGKAVSPDVRVAAFFDVDNTLIPGQAIEVRFFRFLWQRRLVGPREAARSLRYLLSQVPPFSLHPLRERKLYLEGKEAAVIAALAEQFVRDSVHPRLSREGLAALERHRTAGHDLVLITGAPDFLIAPLAGHLRVNTILAAIPERAGGVYTGSLAAPLPYGAGKRHLVELFAKEQEVALKDSYAYGDSPGDRETLELVGHPLVVNPIRGMGRIARRQGWPVAHWK